MPVSSLHIGSAVEGFSQTESQVSVTVNDQTHSGGSAGGG